MSSFSASDNAGAEAMVDRYLGEESNEWPRWPQTEISAALCSFEDVLRGTIWTVRAPGSKRSRTEAAEEAFASFAGTPHALLVSSGTVAVELAVRALMPLPGSKVVVPALGWFATAAAVKRAGAIPVFADIDPLTSCIDPEAVERLIDDKVIAVIAVHLHCALANLDALLALCQRHELTLIEDCAQAYGAIYGGRPIGTIGIMGCFSLNQEKMVAIGEGGCVITSDANLNARLHALRTDGYVRDGGGRHYRPQSVVLGGNACMNEFAAALVEIQLARFASQQEIRGSVARRLMANLAGIKGVIPLATADGTTLRSFHEFAFTLSPEIFGTLPARRHAEALELALGFPIHQTDEPTQLCPMMALRDAVRPAPQAQDLYERLLVFHHRILLDERIVERLPEALLGIDPGGSDQGDAVRQC